MVQESLSLSLRAHQSSFRAAAIRNPRGHTKQAKMWAWVRTKGKRQWSQTAKLLFVVFVKDLNFWPMPVSIRKVFQGHPKMSHKACGKQWPPRNGPCRARKTNGLAQFKTRALVLANLLSWWILQCTGGYWRQFHACLNSGTTMNLMLLHHAAPHGNALQVMESRTVLFCRGNSPCQPAIQSTLDCAAHCDRRMSMA